MKILNSYKGCFEKEILAMSKEDLQQAVIRVLSVKSDTCEKWYGPMYSMDKIADAFRGFLQKEDYQE